MLDPDDARLVPQLLPESAVADRAALSVTGDGGARSVQAAVAADEAERDRALRCRDA